MKWLLLLLLIPALAWAHPYQRRCLMAEISLPVISSGSITYNEFADEYNLTVAFARAYDDFDAEPFYYRAYFVFNTSLIPAGASIVSATLDRVFADGYPAGAGTATIYYRATSSPPAANFAFYNGGTTAVDEITTASSPATAELDFNAAGIAALNLSGNTTILTYVLFSGLLDTVYEPTEMMLRVAYIPAEPPEPRKVWPFKARAE